jgi:hypothetical protein
MRSFCFRLSDIAGTVASSLPHFRNNLTVLQDRRFLLRRIESRDESEEEARVRSPRGIHSDAHRCASDLLSSFSRDVLVRVGAEASEQLFFLFSFFFVLFLKVTVLIVIVYTASGSVWLDE